MEEAAGPAIHFNLFYKIMELFPNACPDYLRQVCSGKEFSEKDINETIEEILTTPNYPKRQLKVLSPKRELNSEEQSSMVKSILPDIDPQFLSAMIRSYRNRTEDLRICITKLLDSQDYPRMKIEVPEPIKKPQKILTQQLQYTTKFSIENFLKLFPDPDAHFNDPERKPSIKDMAKDQVSYQYAVQFLKNMYNTLSSRTVFLEFRVNNFNVVKTAAALEKLGKRSKAQNHGAVRRTSIYHRKIENIPLLQEIAYVKHRSELKSFINKRNRELKVKRNEAKSNGLMKTCQCCFDEEVMPDEVVECENNCLFCKSCLNKSVEIGFSEGKTHFTCLDNCASHFNLKMIQNAIAPKLFSKLLQKKQLEEVQAAGIDGLAMCPFCNFAIIMDPNNKILQCLNMECMKETCRLCKEPSHIPLRCDEIERDDDIKARIYMESQMTEALLRKCYNCGLKFIKSDGCNKITCSCGAKMCYICQNPIKDYTHFNGPGGDEYEKCPLFSDTNQLHENCVKKEAENVKQELKTRFPKTKLIHDPSVDIEHHYREIRRRNPEHLPAGV